MREMTAPVRCPECLEFGHIARTCENKLDRGQCCLNCSKPRHKVKERKNEPECAICGEKVLIKRHSIRYKVALRIR